MQVAELGFVVNTVMHYTADMFCDVLILGVTDNVLIGKENHLFEVGKKSLW